MMREEEKEKREMSKCWGRGRKERTWEMMMEKEKGKIQKEER